MTEKTIVYSEKAPAPIGPYSQAVKAGHLLYTAGQIPLDAVSGAIIGTSVKEQTRQVLENLKAVLEAGGATMDDVIKTTVFLKNMSDFPEFNSVYGEYFGEDKAPARSTVEVARLPKDVLVEVEAVALVV